MFQINTLSFAYHSVLWIFFGLVGAWYAARSGITCRSSRSRLTWRDCRIIVAVVRRPTSFVVLPLFLKYKGEL